MKTRLWSRAVRTLSATVHAQQPPDPIANDGWADTAMGSAALGHHAINYASGTTPGPWTRLRWQHRDGFRSSG